MILPSFNPLRVSKLLDLAGHPTTTDCEALSAIRRASKLCSNADMTLGNAVVVDSEIFFNVTKVPMRVYLAKIADLEEEIGKLNELLKLSMAEKASALAARADLENDLERARDETTKVIAKAHAAAAGGECVTLTGAVDEDAREEPLSATDQLDCSCEQPDDGTFEESVFEASIRNEQAEFVEEVHETAAPRTLRWTKRVMRRFRTYVRIGMAARQIAGLLASEFKRHVTTANVSKKIQGLWQPDAEGFYVFAL